MWRRYAIATGAVLLLLGLAAPPAGAQAPWTYEATFDIWVRTTPTIIFGEPVLEVHNPSGNSGNIRITRIHVPWNQTSSTIVNPVPGSLQHRNAQPCNLPGVPIVLPPGEGLSLHLLQIVEGNCLLSCPMTYCNPNAIPDPCLPNCWCIEIPGIPGPNNGMCSPMPGANIPDRITVEVDIDVSGNPNEEERPVVRATSVFREWQSGTLVTIGVKGAEVDRRSKQ